MKIDARLEKQPFYLHKINNLYLNKISNLENSRFFIYCILGSILVLAAFILEANGWNGPKYWRWPWRHVNYIQVYMSMAPGFLLTITPVCLAITNSPYRMTMWKALCFIVCGHFLMQIGGISSTYGLHYIAEIIKSPGASSYYTEALKITDVKTYLSQFHLTEKVFHAGNKPPIPVLFEYGFIKLAGKNAAALSGLAIGALGSISIISIASLSNALGHNFERTLWTVTIFSLGVGPIVFFPEFDQVYPWLACLLLTFQLKAQKPFDVKSWSAFALCLVFVTLWTYNILPIGVCCVLILLHYVKEESRPLIYLLKTGGVVLAVFSLIYYLIYELTGFRPIATFLHALEVQGGHSYWLKERTYLNTLAGDMPEFLLRGTGAPIAFLGLSFIPLVYRKTQLLHKYFFEIAGLFTVFTVNLTGVLRAETSRVWIFLVPFFAFAMSAVLELSSDNLKVKEGRQLLLFYLLSMFIYVVVCRTKFHFIGA